MPILGEGKNCGLRKSSLKTWLPKDSRPTGSKGLDHKESASTFVPIGSVTPLPANFVFRLTAEEVRALRCQIGTSKGRGGRRNLPIAFTEHGAIMAASILNSRQAVEMSVFVVRAFVRMRALLGDTRELPRRLAALEKELKERLDVHEVAIVSILQRVMDLIDPPAASKSQLRPRKKIGFEVKEPAVRYGRRRRRN
jgi:hypothetical protein